MNVAERSNKIQVKFKEAVMYLNVSRTQVATAKVYPEQEGPLV